MAGYDYRTYSPPGYSNGKGVGPRTNVWRKSSYTDDDDDDDECRTVIVDADGTKRTIIGCTPIHKQAGSYVTKTETIIEERIIAPVFPAVYKRSSPLTTVEPVKGYGYADDYKVRRPSSPVKGYGYSADDHKLRRPLSPVKGYGYSANDQKLRRPSSPVKAYGYSADDQNLRRPSSPVKDYGYSADDQNLRRPSSPVKGYGHSADDQNLRRPSSPVKGYGYSADDQNLRRPSSPVKGYDQKLRRPLSPVKGYGHSADDQKLRRPSSPVKGYGYSADDHKLHNPSSPVKGYGYAANDQKLLHRPSSPEDDYPREVGDFLTKLQLEASRDQPSRIGPSNGVNYQRQPPQQTGHNGTAGYGDYSDYNNKTFNKPSGNTIRNDNYDGYNRKNDSDRGPNMISNGGIKARPIPPIPSTLASPPSREGRLTSATDDMETALRYLKESAKSLSAPTTMPQYSNHSAVPKQDEYRRDPAKRNVRFNGPSWP